MAYRDTQIIQVDKSYGSRSSAVRYRDIGMKSVTIILLGLSIILLITCSLSEPEILTGTIESWAHLRSESGIPASQHTGVKVSLNGEETYETTTDIEGYWILENIEAGIYTINYSKEGYGNAWQQNFQFVGNGTFVLPPDFLNEIPSFIISDFSIEVDSVHSSYLNYYITLSPSSNHYRRVLVYFAADPGFSSELYKSYCTIRYDYSTADQHVSSQYIKRDIGAISGDTVYAKAYPLSKYDGEWDRKTNETIFTALGEPSEVLAFEIP